MVISWQDLEEFKAGAQGKTWYRNFWQRNHYYVELERAVRDTEDSTAEYEKESSFKNLDQLQASVSALNKLIASNEAPRSARSIQKVLRETFTAMENSLANASHLPSKDQPETVSDLLKQTNCRDVLLQSGKKLIAAESRLLLKNTPLNLDRDSRREAMAKRQLLATVFDIAAIFASCALFWVYFRKREKAEQELKEAKQNLQTANDLLYNLAHRDPLTLVLNRRGLEKQLAIETNRASRSGQLLNALIIDCDDFKSINERVGHNGGDYVLTEIARRTSEALRSTDLVARVGGDEFVAVFPTNSADEASTLADRIRSQIANQKITTPEGEITATVSIALSVLPTTFITLEEILATTREALKQSKDLGKNRVSLASVK
jgi:diguanylate cyclase (GGDEF)-like protein